MLKKSDANISRTLEIFNRSYLDVSLIVPTVTGLEKSIMDATKTVKKHLIDTDFHDFNTQRQGPSYKIIKRAFFVRPNGLEETMVSLYRPQTKSGDPRIWFGDLRKYAEPFNLLAILIQDDIIYVVNCSRPEVIDSIDNPESPLGKLASTTHPIIDTAVTELLWKMRKISRQGFITTLRSGDTGVGYTLETLLGIKANTKQIPDFKGIEIKAKRMRRGRSNRVTLFSKAPDWDLSPIGSAWNLLNKYGYIRHGNLKLNHEIRAQKPNSIGFILETDTIKDWLKQNHYDFETMETQHVTTWEMEVLRERLKVKHPQTFWVEAQCRGRGRAEEFHYTRLEHTQKPNIRNFDALLDVGVITVDYLMSQKGEGRVRDHGYLFKIHPDNFDALFPPSEIHIL